MEYDRILKYNDDGEACESCIGLSTEELGCNQWILELKRPVMNICTAYANAAQLEGLIKEAESGAHQWVRENTLFVCEHFESCETVPCALRNGIEFLSGKMGCKREGRTIKFIPYRGTPGEPCVFPTAEDCTDVERIFVCDNYWADIGCDGYGEESCSLTIPHLSQGNKPVRSCYSAREIESRPKQDRSDTEGNDKKEESEETLQTKLERFAEPLKETIEDMEKEYVVLKDYCAMTLAEAGFNPELFVKFFLQYGADESWRKGGSDILFSSKSANTFREELLRLGFIEEKVCDPIIGIGDTFLHEDGALYFVQKYDGGRAVLVSPTEEGHYLYPRELEGLTLKKLTFNNSYSQDAYFTKVDVEIREV